MPRSTPTRSGSYLRSDLYAIRRYLPGEMTEKTEYWFFKIARVSADGYARYNRERFRWHSKAELPALVDALRTEDDVLFGYDPNEPLDFIKLWEPLGPYRQFWWN